MEKSFITLGPGVIPEMTIIMIPRVWAWPLNRINTFIAFINYCIWKIGLGALVVRKSDIYIEFEYLWIGSMFVKHLLFSNNFNGSQFKGKYEIWNLSLKMKVAT